MPNECLYCGEIKLCRMTNMNSILYSIMGFICTDPYISHDWICKDCDEAKAIIRNRERLMELKKQKINQINWIKERDKLLKENRKYVQKL